MSDLQFCMGASMATGSLVGRRDDVFFALEQMPAGTWPGRAAALGRRPELPSIRLEAALRLRPPRALSSAEAPGHYSSPDRLQEGRALFSFCSHRLGTTTKDQPPQPAGARQQRQLQDAWLRNRYHARGEISRLAAHQRVRTPLAAFFGPEIRCA